MASIKREHRTLEHFIRKANEVHKYRYGYRNSAYTHSRIRTEITCHIHGSFYQTPATHLRGRGCPMCKGVRVGNALRSNIETFIKKALSVHGERYDYSGVVYLGAQIKVNIRCLKHGVFRQSPNSHLSGSICPKCKHEEHSLSLRGTKEDFVARASILHKGRYGYDRFIYTNQMVKSTITCLKHGDFEQDAHSHLRGNGCLKCFTSRGEDKVSSVLDKHDIKYVREFRIRVHNFFNRFRYDFLLVDSKILIEFHGEQHYRAVGFFGGEDGFSHRVKSDLAKKKLAKFAKYKLIVIPYTTLDLSDEEFEDMLLCRLKISVAGNSA